MKFWLISLILVGSVQAADYCETHTPDTVQAQTQPRAMSIALGRVVKQSSDTQFRIVAGAARGLQAELRAIGLDATVTPYLITEPCSPGVQGDCFRHLPREGHTHWHVWGGNLPGLCGNAFRPGNRAWTSISCRLPTIKHEQGHNLGFGHSGQDGGSEFGWATWMGSGFGRFEFAAPHIAQIRDVVESEGEGAHFLASAYDPVYPGETNLIRVGSYTVSQWRSRLAISRPDTGNKIWLLAELRDGEMARIGGITYRNDGIERGAIRALVGDSKPAGFPAVPSAGERPANGTYAAQNASHQGLIVFSRDDYLIIYWMTWGPNETPRWYLAVGTHEDLEIHRSIQGRLIRVGTGQIDSGRFDFWLDDDPRGRLDLEQIAIPADSAIFSTGELSGLALQSRPDGTVYGYWLRTTKRWSVFGYEHETHWFLVDGDPQGQLRIYEPHGGHPGVKVDSGIDLWGFGKLTDRWEWSGDGSGSSELVRLL